MPDYNKLVRGKIPEIITANGDTAVTKTLTDDNEYEHALIQKFGEEYKELAQADTTEAMMEELADLQEVVLALARHIGSERQLEEIRIKKAEERGGFDDRIYLIRTE